MSGSAKEYRLVESQAELDGLAERVAPLERVALDTEGDSLYHYYEKVCLLQVAVHDGCYLIDPLAGLDLGALLGLLADRVLIFHGSDYDLRLLRSTYGFGPGGGVFDTMIAAQLLGQEQIGLAALVEHDFGVALGKKGKKSNWSRRPLSASQLAYASDDVRYLEALADRLEAALRRLGRLEWHRQSCAAVVEATAQERPQDPSRVWRIKGLRGLGRRQLAFVRELWHWRDHEAQRADLPPFRVLGHRQLRELALWAAAHPNASLSQGPKLPRSCEGRRRRALEGAIRRAGRLRDPEWPEHLRGKRRPRLDRAARRRIGELRSACARLADDLGLAAAVLAPRAAVGAVVVQEARTVEDIMAAGSLLRWQAELVASALPSP